MLNCGRLYALIFIASPLTVICNVFDGGQSSRLSDCQPHDQTAQYECIVSKLRTIDGLQLKIRHDLYWHQKKRIRRECRALPREEREDLFDAINVLKKDTSISPNVYDAFADIHTGHTIKVVHDGPNFFGWHRYYILLFEELLRKVNPNVTLCYWDSRLDHVMGYPWGSVMFTDEFAGNHNGHVKTGPFAGWKTIRGVPLERHMGNGGSFITPSYYDNILSKKSHVGITGKAAKSTSNLETIHNAVHMFIGGQMGNFNTSTQDPLFWIHHSFVDSIWEKFCMKLRLNNIDPQDDYIMIKNKFHHPNKYMETFFPLRNIDGYSDYFRNNIYEYEDYSSCPDCSNSPYLKCNSDNMCYTIKKHDRRRKVSSTTIETNHLSAPLNTITFLSENASSEEWVFVPVKIVFRNALSKSLQSKRITGCENADLDDDLCNKSVAIVTSYGINYNGTYTNYIVDDVGIPHYIYTYVGVKNPTTGISETYITVTDKNGNQCNQQFLSSSKNTNNQFSGIISVSAEDPKIYLDTLDDDATSKFPFYPLEAESFDKRIKMIFSCY